MKSTHSLNHTTIQVTLIFNVNLPIDGGVPSFLNHVMAVAKMFIMFTKSSTTIFDYTKLEHVSRPLLRRLGNLIIFQSVRLDATLCAMASCLVEGPTVGTASESSVFLSGGPIHVRPVQRARF